MTLIAIIILLGCPFFSIAQHLSIQETVNYINEKLGENPALYKKFNPSISLHKDRLFLHYESHKTSLSVYNILLDEIALRVDYPNSSIIIPCKSYKGECLYEKHFEHDKEVLKNKSCLINEPNDNNIKLLPSVGKEYCIKIDFTSGDEIGENLFNAFDYLIKKTLKTYKINKKLNDPFAHRTLFYRISS